MSKKKALADTHRAQAKPGSNGRRLAKSRTRDEIIPAHEVQLVDKALDFFLDHQMRRTASDQAKMMTQVRRQAELDGFRGEQALWMYNDLLAKAAKNMSDLCDFRDASMDEIHPDAAVRFERMVDRALEIQEKLPEAGVMIFLRRCALV